MSKDTKSIKHDVSGEVMHIRDVNIHDIFKNNVLTSQFLRDYTGISIFSDIKPEDIEDQTKKFRLLLGIEVEGDIIKKIHLRIGDKTEDIFVISLIEHKSMTDYDTAMQLYYYMAVIWRDFAKNHNEQRKDANKSKDFRYPLIIPIVYYEGTGEWKAGMHLSDRVSHAELAMEYIPDFTYKVIPLRDFDSNDLKTHQDEMSLILMINKIQGAEDFHEFLQTALDYMNTIYKKTSPDIQQLIQDVIWGLMMKVKIPEEKATEVIAGVREGEDMGTLFEHFQTFDWKGVNEELEKTKSRLKDVEVKLEQTEARAKQEKDRADENEARARQEKDRADENEARAKQEKERADEGEARAEQEKARADRLEQELQDLRKQLK